MATQVLADSFSNTVIDRRTGEGGYVDHVVEAAAGSAVGDNHHIHAPERVSGDGGTECAPGHRNGRCASAGHRDGHGRFGRRQVKSVVRHAIVVDVLMVVGHHVGTFSQRAGHSVVLVCAQID